jgi:hypothetical protein
MRRGGEGKILQSKCSIFQETKMDVCVQSEFMTDERRCERGAQGIDSTGWRDGAVMFENEGFRRRSQHIPGVFLDNKT